MIVGGIKETAAVLVAEVRKHNFDQPHGFVDISLIERRLVQD